MKCFLPADGLFEITFPMDWTYNLSNGYIHQFHFIKGIGSFHLSLLNEAARTQFNNIRNNPNIIKRNLKNSTIYELTIDNEHEFITTVWHLQKDEIMFLASHTFATKFKNTKKFKSERKIILEILNSLKIVHPENRQLRISCFRFEKFLGGLEASEIMFDNAAKNGCFLECVCLLANQIDGMLRVANILFDQIQKRSSDINLSFIYQGENDKIKTEKNIYDISRDKGIIDQKLFDELYLEYKQRNRVVHRYVISEISTRDILEIAYRYSIIKNTVWQIVYELENNQLDLGLGMTAYTEKLPKDKLKESNKIFNISVSEKLGGLDLKNKPSDLK